jgi:hypothetical protein
MTITSGDAVTDSIDETYVTATDGTRRRNHYALFMSWTRRIHMYADLFMLPWALLYGTSAMFFNHADLLPVHKVSELRIDALDSPVLAALPEPAV